MVPDMKKKSPNTLYKALCLVIGAILLLCLLWAHIGEHNGYRKLIEALLTVVPIIYLTYFIAADSSQYSKNIENINSRHSHEMEKINRRALFLRESEKYLQELESWAQEMFVTTTYSQDQEIVNAQAVAGIKHAYSRHLLTRHGRNYDGGNKGGNPFPSVRVHTPGVIVDDVLVPDIKALSVWKRRFAQAVTHYMRCYELFTKLVEEDHKKNSESNYEAMFQYENTFMGLLYTELKETYGQSPSVDSIILELHPQISPASQA